MSEQGKQEPFGGKAFDDLVKKVAQVPRDLVDAAERRYEKKKQQKKKKRKS